MPLPNDLDRLAKCLELATSDNDHEALAALRKANAIRKRLGFGWADLLARGSIQTPDTGPGERQSDGSIDIDAAFALIMANPDLNDWESNFIHGSYEQWRRHRGLSPAQKKILFQLYERHAFAARARNRKGAPV